jgi:LCP family protein required for cell wall assembly
MGLFNNKRKSKTPTKQMEVDLVKARSATSKQPPLTAKRRAEQTFDQRAHKARVRNRTIIIIVSVVVALAAAVASAYFAYFAYLNSQLHTNLDAAQLQPALSSDVDIQTEPFYALFCGIDDTADTVTAQSVDLLYCDPANKHITIVSIPAQTKIKISGHGNQRINMAYLYGRQDGGSGQAAMVRAVSDLCGVNISVYAQLTSGQLSSLVDALGGVQVFVPTAVPSGKADDSLALQKGDQKIDGEQALTLCKSTDYTIGDYQRQANVRTFLQALISQVAGAGMPAGLSSLGALCADSTASVDAHQILDLAAKFAGIHPYDIYSYALSCYNDVQNGVSYEIPNTTANAKFFQEIENEQYPDVEDMDNQGVTPDSYKPQAAPISDASGGSAAAVDTSQYVVDVWNGYGIPDAARSVSDMLGLAGYKQGKIANAAAFAYTETLVVYKDDDTATATKNLAAAKDILARIGYGRIIPSEGRYTFTGDVLVVVGADYKS